MQLNACKNLAPCLVSARKVHDAPRRKGSSLFPHVEISTPVRRYPRQGRVSKTLTTTQPTSSQVEDITGIRSRQGDRGAITPNHTAPHVHRDENQHTAAVMEVRGFGHLLRHVRVALARGHASSCSLDVDFSCGPT